MERTQLKTWIFFMVFLCLTIEIRCQAGKPFDLCSKNPCYHGGICVQTSVYPGYKCRCFGTGYHGERCQHQCPRSVNSVSKRQSNFPSECIVI